MKSVLKFLLFGLLFDFSLGNCCHMEKVGGKLTCMTYTDTAKCNALKASSALMFFSPGKCNAFGKCNSGLVYV